MAVLPLRVQDGDSLRKFVFGKMVVAYDHVYAPFPCVFDLLVCLDSAVEGDDQAEAVFGGPVDALVRDSVSLIISFRDIEVQLAGKPAKERVYKRHGSRAVHIVVSIDKDLLG